MSALTPSFARHLCVALVLLVPLVVDPVGDDTLALKRLALALCGLVALAFEAIELLGGRRLPAPLRGVDKVFLALATWGALGLFWAPNTQLGLLELAALLGMLGLVRAQRAVTRDVWDLRRWLGWILVAGLIAIALDSFLLLTRPSQLTLAQSKFASVLFGHNNIAGGYAVLLPPLGLALIVGARAWGPRLLGLAPLIAVPAYVWQLRNRAGMLALLVGVGISGAVLLLRAALERGARPSPRLLRWMAVLALLIGLAPLSSSARAWSKARFYNVINVMEAHGLGNLDDSGFRPNVYRKTLEMVRDTSWRGVGPGNFAVEFPRYEAQHTPKPHAHNDALHMLGDYGLPGLFLFLGLIGAILWDLVRALVAGREVGAFVCAAGLLGSVGAFVVGGLFEASFLFGAQVSLLVIFAGLSGRLGEVDLPRSRRVLGRPARAWLALVLAIAGIALVLRRIPASWMMERGVAAEARGDLDAARASYGWASRMGTGYSLPARELARLAMQESDPQRALDHLADAEALSPNLDLIWRAQANAYLKLSRAADAVERLERARAASPGERVLLHEHVRALAAAGRFQSAIDQLEYRLHADRLSRMDAVVLVAKLYRESTEGTEVGSENWLHGWVGSRHFEAVLLEYGPPEQAARAAAGFKHATHQLQSLDGAPGSWWPSYERFLADGGWEMPALALWTSVDADGVKLFPGWAEAAGPPLPLERR
ncbi:MAG: hypothetical protein DHS20C15_03380 [Planctomycetota bacterium]|nr:MAG: hypothetical protein DHS20C15_03380 [Planctomycetota bacterium]